MNEQIEKKIRAHAVEIFGGTLPEGHRERFEQRLRTSAAAARGGKASGKRPSTRWQIAAAAAMLAGALILWNRPAEGGATALAEVRNYYEMQLASQAEAVRQQALSLDGVCRETLLEHIAQIENAPTPEVQIPDDDYIVLIVHLYEDRRDALQHIQQIIEMNY